VLHNTVKGLVFLLAGFRKIPVRLAPFLQILDYSGLVSLLRLFCYINHTFLLIIFFWTPGREDSDFPGSLRMLLNGDCLMPFLPGAVCTCRDCKS
jgi:hypothetical protein